ncbi:MAG: type VI secretion system Vgr family protein, partial [Pseudomonas sp.]
MDAVAIVLSALGAPGQHERLLRLHTPLGADRLVPATFAGVESVDGAGFRFEVEALSVDAGLALDALLGRPVLLELLTADSRTAPRPFHGHVTLAELQGSNGGLARYRLVIEPWLALLDQRVDSYVFHDMSVVDIVENVFADYVGQGAVDAAWRWDLADRSVYPRRSLTTQYQESDLAFVRRLLAEEGIYYWFEHAGDTNAEALGTHTLVLADHAQAMVDAGTVRFHRGDVTEREDSLQQWSVSRRARASRLSRASWDYRSLDLRPASAQAEAEGFVAEDADTSGPYGWIDRAQGQ